LDYKTIIIYESVIGRLVFRYDSPLWISEIDGVSSVEIDISESRSTGQVGSSVSSRSVRPRSVPIEGSVFDPIDTNRDRVIDIMAPQANATLTVIKNGKSWYLDVTPEKTPDFTPGVGVQYFQARLHAAYPYWRSTNSYATQIAGLIAMFKFPFFTGGKWWISKYSDSFFATLDNDGNVPQDFRVIFAARSAIVNPELYQVDTGKRILIRKAMVAGERVIASTIYGKKGVICISAKGEITNGFRYLSVDSNLSMSLLPGPNLLRIDASDNRAGLSVRIEAQEGVKSGV
jgi:hypothetical protein